MDTRILDYTESLLTNFKGFLTDFEGNQEEFLKIFAEWLINQELDEINSEHPGGEMLDTFIGMQLIIISNMVRNRLNKFVTNSPFSTFMDYQFLYVLKEHGEMTKSEIISINFMEMSSGIEVIKRLIKKEWICEKDNPKDKRSKLVLISSIGIEIVSQYQLEASHLYSSFSSGLFEKQSNFLFKSLKKIIEKDN